MSGGNKQTTNTSQSNPWQPAQEPLKENIRKAGEIGPESFMPFPDSTVVADAPQTKAGLSYLENLGTQNIGGRGISGHYKGAIERGGVANPFQQGAAATMQDFAGGSSPYRDIAQRAMGPSYSEQNLMEMAAGKQIGSSNPYLEDALDEAAQKAAHQTNEAAASAGRYGSGAHTGALAKTIGDIQTNARAQQVNQDISRMMQSNTMLDNQRLQGLGLGMQGMRAQEGAAGNLFNVGQQAFRNLGDAYHGAQLPADTLARVGASEEDLAMRELNDRIRLFEGKQRAPIDAINWQNAIYSGAGSLGGRNTSTAQAPGQNPWATAAGIGSTLAGGLGSIFP